jgi:acyl-CoA reductase-like NAD-dependent aldehyde dehydrogenase
MQCQVQVLDKTLPNAEMGTAHWRLSMADREAMMVAAAKAVKVNAQEMVRLLREMEESKIFQIKPEIINLVLDLDSFIERIDKLF